MMTLQAALVIVKNRERHKQDLLDLRARFERECPRVMAALQIVEQSRNKRRVPKGYNLCKRANGKLGFVYYVRYYHGGRMLTSKWCTHTNDREEAVRFALENRERLVRGYLGRHEARSEMEKTISTYFDKGSMTLLLEEKRNRSLSEQRRREYSRVLKKFLNFLRERGIRNVAAITSNVLIDYQDKLLLDKLKPQTINDMFTAVRRLTAYWVRKGEFARDPAMEVKSLPIKEADRVTHGIYDLDKLRGVFEKPWENETFRLLNMFIYMTNMRNSEILRFRLADVEEAGGVKFLRLDKSKTLNGQRLVPLHPRLYEAILSYSGGGLVGELLFGGKSERTMEKYFRAAYLELGERLGVGADELKKENITFYSGRAFWKTVMSDGGLGEDIEEVFMGHKVSGDVKKLYNHRDKHGKEQIAGKALDVFAILDRRLFGAG